AMESLAWLLVFLRVLVVFVSVDKSFIRDFFAFYKEILCMPPKGVAVGRILRGAVEPGRRQKRMAGGVRQLEAPDVAIGLKNAVGQTVRRATRERWRLSALSDRG